MQAVSNTRYVQAALALAKEAEKRTIPYSIGGDGLSGMDCQGLCEYLLTACGIPKRECNLPGSNAHWRACRYRASIGDCRDKYGCVPEGAWLFIQDDNDMAAPPKYRGDGMGNASHMGVMLPGNKVLHASFSRARVVVSALPQKAVRGGFNMVGLPKWIEYSGEKSDKKTMEVIDVSGFYTVRRGCLGGAVRRLQSWLTLLGYHVGRHGADGRFGRETESAVLCFQNDHGLDMDGIVGQKTWKALGKMRMEHLTERDEAYDMG